MVDRVTCTSATRDLIAVLEEQHGPLVFHQSGGCCDGSAPMCFAAGDFPDAGGYPAAGYPAAGRPAASGCPAARDCSPAVHRSPASHDFSVSMAWRGIPARRRLLRERHRVRLRAARSLEPRGHLDAAFERIREWGAEVLQEPMQQDWGPRDCAFRDPAGNHIRLNQAA